MPTQADHLRSAGPDEGRVDEDSTMRCRGGEPTGQPSGLPLGAEAPPPHFALAVVFTVMAGFFVMQVVDILDQGVTPLDIALVFTVLPALIGCQVAQTLPRLRPLRDRYGRAILLAQVLLVVLPCALFGWAWGGMGGFVGASALLVLETRKGIAVFGTLVALIALSTGARSGFGTVAVPYMVVSSLLTGIIVYSLIRLATLTIAVHEAREDFARIAIVKERLRFARDLHDLLGYSLSAITLKGELACQLVGRAPDQARDELLGIIDISRQALADVREVAHSYRSLSLLNELSSARSVLSVAGIEAHVRIDYDRLSAEADTELATVLREGVTNVMRHSEASRCRIEATQRDGVVRLCIANDGVPAKENSGRRGGSRGGSGLQNLTERMTAVGGRLTAGVDEDGWFRLVAETAPAPPAAGAGRG
ncbi:two-component system, NarL family, sensor histidine kinase DesK [Streptomyces misionensis]|uniref:Two-component system, NarL family, sensor histidine kinase DesK n=1 Tax=Streptomyces misionensis TaxID=67331 RepID=A0A1H4IBP3_9ACTN|nr:histidine kinase [Streptomyces misionensis]SEB31136.1 two-component system, NarL family, sensor histidine kinase DesK [Streptomyces misionensis]